MKNSNFSDTILQIVEYLFLTIDLLCNIFDDYLGYKLTFRMSVYIVQDLCQILSLILLCLLFFRSVILETDSFGLIFRQYSYSLLVSVIYLCTTVFLQFQIISVYWDQSVHDNVDLNTKEWMKYKFILIWFVGQRIFAAIYYVCYKRVSDKLHDKELVMRLIGQPNEFPSKF